MANKIRISIGGVEYMLMSDDDELTVRKTADELNRHIDSVKLKNPHLSTTMVAVLTALDYCEELAKAKDEISKLQLQLKNTVEDAACARFEGDQARREIERLTQEINAIRNSDNGEKDGSVAAEEIKLF